MVCVAIYKCNTGFSLCFVRYDDLVLITKDKNKKIIRVSGSCIKDDHKICSGSLFIGKDITRDIETHGRLLEGNSYLIPDKENTSK